MKDLLLSGLILFTIDIIWIKLFMGGHFQKLIKNIQGQEMSVKIQMKNNTLFTQRLKHIFKLLC